MVVPGNGCTAYVRIAGSVLFRKSAYSVHTISCMYVRHVCAYTYTRSRYGHAYTRDTNTCVKEIYVDAYTHETVGIAKAEIRGVYVVASVSAAGPWGQRAA